jgi:hypothetical protein
MQLLTGDFTEHAYGVEIVDANVSDTDYFDIRIDSGIVTTSAANTARVTIDKASTTPITGTTSIAFTPTSGIKGIGVLASTIANAFTPTSLIKGIGVLASTAAIAFTATSTLTQAATPITGTTAIVFTPTSGLKGIGVLSASSAGVFSPASSLKGIGVLAASTSGTFTTSSTLTAAAGASSSNLLWLPPEWSSWEMMEGRKPTNEVEIDWSHSLAEGLHGCWLLDKTISPDLTGNNAPVIVGGASIVATEKGLAIQTSDGNYATIADFDPPHQGTICVLMNRTTDDGARMRVLGFSDAYETQINAGDTYNNDLFQASGSNTTSTGTNTVNEWVGFISTYDFVSNDAKIYINGVEDGTSALADDDPGGPATLTLGNRTGSTAGDAFNGQFAYLFIYDRVLSAAEIQSLHHDPYQFLKTTTPRLKIGAGVAETPSFWIPDPRWELWELMEGRHPVSPVMLDLTNPLTEGLYRAIISTDAGLFDLVSGRFVPYSDGFAFTNGYARSNSDDRLILTGFPLYPDTWGFTALCSYNPVTALTSQHVLWYDSADLDGTTDYNGFADTGTGVREIHFGANGSGNISFTCQIADNASAGNVIASGSSIPLNEESIILGVSNSNRVTDIRINGGASSSSGTADNNTPNASAGSIINNVGNAARTDRYLRGGTRLFFSWHRVLDDAEQIEISVRPRQFLIPVG